MATAHRLGSPRHGLAKRDFMRKASMKGQSTAPMTSSKCIPCQTRYFCCKCKNSATSTYIFSPRVRVKGPGNGEWFISRAPSNTCTRAYNQTQVYLYSRYN